MLYIGDINNTKEFQLNIDMSKKLKDFIVKYVVSSTGINSNASKESFWLERDATLEMFKEIKTYSFLKEPKMNECVFNFLNNITKPPKCDCGNKLSFVNYKKGYREHCSLRCSKKYGNTNEKTIQTNLERYGVEYPIQNKDIRDKITKTNLEKYGVENASSNENIKNKRTKTFYERYGVSCALKNDKFKEKTIQTNLERYGVEYPIQLDKFKKKQKETNLERYGSEYISQTKSFKNLVIQKTITKFNEKNNFKLLEYNKENFFIKCVNCDKEFNRKMSSLNYVRLGCPYCGYNSNKIEEILKKELGLINIGFKNKQIIKPLELDIFVNSANIAIEYNGMLFHSYGKSKYSKFNNHTEENKNYHLNKTQLCEEKGIQLFHIFENEWMEENKREIWKSVIANKLNNNQNKIYARKCIIKEVSKKDSDLFLTKNHLQGVSQSSIKLGLYYNDELVSLMTLGKSRFNKNYDYELIRFCSKLNTSVIGGASKLLKYFERKYKPNSIISYANRRWSQGNLYEKLGFDISHNASPNYFYLDKKDKYFTLYSRQQFQKHKLKDKLEIYDESLSESENMFNNGYRRIWDCGNKVYIKIYRD